MDLVYLFDAKRRCVVDDYEETVLPIILGASHAENIVSIIHYAIQQLDQLGKEKFEKNAELVVKQIFMNDETLACVQTSNMWSPMSDVEDPSVVGQLFKIGTVQQMKTLSGSRVQLCVAANTGRKFNYALFGLIDIL
jgi:hypothetical protein